MKLKTLLTLLILLSLYTTGYAQTKVKMYRNGAGKLYTTAQKDSIRAIGFPIAITDETIVGDTSFFDIEVLPKENGFVQKYKNKALPSFSLKTLDGNVVDSNSLKGKVVMINFWSTTCGPCILEFLELNKLKERYEQVVFLAPAPEDAAKINKLLSKHSFEFLILPNAKELFEKWGIEDYPKNFFVYQKGIIREVKEGTPILNEKDKQGRYKVAVMQSYSPILDDLTKE